MSTTTTLGTLNLWPVLTGGRCSEVALCYKKWKWDFKMWLLLAGGYYSEVVVSSGFTVLWKSDGHCNNERMKQVEQYSFCSYIWSIKIVRFYCDVMFCKHLPMSDVIMINGINCRLIDYHLRWYYATKQLTWIRPVRRIQEVRRKGCGAICTGNYHWAPTNPSRLAKHKFCCCHIGNGFFTYS